MPIQSIQKRNGAVVAFSRHKIEHAITKAAAEVKADLPEEKVIGITDSVITQLEALGIDVPGVEMIQDTVEQKIVEHGFFPVARAYIVYRERHAAIREQAKAVLIEKMKARELTVTKRDGSVVPFDVNEITEAVINACNGYKQEIATNEVIHEAMSNLYDGISTKEINQAIIMALKGRIEKNPAYSWVAARFLFNDLYKEVLGTSEFVRGFQEAYGQGFTASVKQGVDAERLDPRMLEFDTERLGAALVPERDQLFRYLGAQTLYDRYFLRDLEQNIMEVPQYFWMRVAMGLSLNEEHREERALEFYNMVSTLRYVPSTPTLFHAGTTHPQMSSCYLTTVEDDLTNIFKSFGDNAQLSKWSGGLGNDWTNVRATGAHIRSTNVGSQGVVPFLKIADATTAAINRSGKRRGATCVYLETWHLDIEDFLELRKNTGDDRRRTHDTNTANWIPDLFMKRVMEDKEWTLLSPDEAPDLHHLYGKAFEKRYAEYEAMVDRGEIELFKRMPAKQLWRQMITMLFSTGHPWMTFKDPCNVRSPQDHVGVVHSSNLCTEITLNTSTEETAVCNLGSINIATHIHNKQLDTKKLAETVHTATRMLDNVIDLNFYPTPEAERSNRRHRPVGLGIMGLQDALYMMDVHFASEAAVQFSDALMEQIGYHAILGSSKLAKERGAYESYKGSKWDRGLFPLDTLSLLEEERGIETGIPKTSTLNWQPVREHVQQYGMRNSNTMAIAPTATISNITGVFPSIEPIYKNIYVKSNVGGEFTTNNPYLIEDLRQLGLWTEDVIEKIKHYDGSIQQIAEIPQHVKDKYKEVFEIDTIWILRHAAHRGKWIDQSQSVNIFVNTTSGKVISEAYANAWRLGLKTTYYLRTLGASAIEKSTLDVNKEMNAPVEVEVKEVVPQRQEAQQPVQQPVRQVAAVQHVVQQAEPAQVPVSSQIYIASEALCEACE